MPIALFGLTAQSEDRFGYAGAERIETRWRARMPNALFGLKAETEVRFGYVNAERMCLHGKWLTKMD
jgi:hypothetical protein